jgi:hypothetical protein
MAAALPESSFERMTTEAREKERLERQKMLVSLPRGKVEQEYLASVAAKVVEGAVGAGFEDCPGHGGQAA